MQYKWKKQQNFLDIGRPGTGNLMFPALAFISPAKDIIE